MPEVGPGLSASSHCQSFIQTLGVVGEETHLRDDVLGEVVDVGQEQTKSAQEQSPEAPQVSPGPRPISHPQQRPSAGDCLRMPVSNAG